MRIFLAYSVLVLIVPVATLSVLPWESSLGLMIVSVLSFQLVRKLAISTKRLVLCAVLINELLYTYSMHRLGSPEVVQFDMDSLRVDPELINPPPRPFVSLVLLSNDAMHATHVRDFASELLVSEIVVPGYTSSSSDIKATIPVHSHLSTSTDFIIYLSPDAILYDGWLAGMVREYFSNATRIVVPVVSLGNGGRVSSAIIGAADGVFRFNPYIEREVDVPLIPVVSAVGVSRTVLDRFPNFSELVNANKIVELSLTAWFCFGGIRATKFTELSMRSSVTAYQWSVNEAPDIDEKIAICDHPGKNINWFRQKFIDWDVLGNPAVFQIIHIPSGKCIRMGTDRASLDLAQCDTGEVPQRFVTYSNNLAVRSLIDDKCMDGASASDPGKSVIMYLCLPGNMNQMFTFVHNRIMWGSFCVDSIRSPLSLEKCTDDASQQFRPHYV